MIKPIFMIALLLALTAATNAQTDTVIFKTVDFSEHPQSETITGEGAEVTLQPIDRNDDGIDVAAAIRLTGYQSIIVKEGAATNSFVKRGVGIGKLSSHDLAPSILLTGYSGGAHCCGTLKAIVPVAGRLKVLEFEPNDGESDQFFPKDIDGDGVVDFVRQDDSFRYQFSSGAGSFSPPVIFNIYKGNIVDVSTEPAFRTVWEKFAAETRKRCMDRSDNDRNGACAAYVASGARLGKFEAAMTEAVQWANLGKDAELPSGCKVELVQYLCPKGQEIKFFDFKSALVWFLRKTKYID